MTKILYVEDNFQNFRLVMRMLSAEDRGYLVERAEDGGSALTRVSEVKPDLIFMDIDLPDLDGIEVTRQIKEKSEYAAIPVIALTANAMVGDREKYLSQGCDDYLRKPISRADLRDVLNRYLPNGKETVKSNGNGKNGSTPAD
jgi:CheY-like chemotaxis protein